MGATPADARMLDLWERIDALVDRLDVQRALAHDLGPLAARRRRALGEELPQELRRAERATRVVTRMAFPVLERARAAYDKPMLVLKGPEVAARYPPDTRHFGDLDVLVRDADAARAALLGGGFVDVDAPEVRYADIGHHVRPVVWPGLPLQIELHTSPKWPRRLAEPDVGELFDAAVESVVGIDGLEAPAPHHHAVLLAVHGWAHGGLRSARDLLDVMVVAAENDRDELEDVARAWGVGRLWATTMAVGDWLVGESMREPAAVRIWARHLRTLRDATVAENHFERWISSFWMLPPRAAAGRAATEIIREFRREQRESWRRKLGRTARSIRHAHTSKTDYGWKR